MRIVSVAPKCSAELPLYIVPDGLKINCESVAPLTIVCATELGPIGGTKSRTSLLVCAQRLPLPSKPISLTYCGIVCDPREITVTGALEAENGKVNSAIASCRLVNMLPCGSNASGPTFCGMTKSGVLDGERGRAYTPMPLADASPIFGAYST